MELSWAIKLRIGAAAAVGIALVGLLGWRWADPNLTTGAVNLSGLVTLVIPIRYRHWGIGLFANLVISISG